MSLQRQVISSLRSTHLAGDPVREVAVDRVLALSLADPLGAALWRLKWGQDARAIDDVLPMLVRRTRRSTEPVGVIRKSCEIALIEWFHDSCLHCGGRGITIAENAVKRTCRVCTGSGKQPPRTKWRIQKLRVDESEYLQRWRPRLERAHATIVRACQKTLIDIEKLLDR